MTKPRTLSQVFILLIFASITLSSCSDSETSTNNQENLPQTTEQIPNDTGVNILTSVFPSPKEQNPYSVENMNKTFKNLILANNANAKDIPELEANFLYVRFLPYGKKGAYELKTYDTSLVLFKHPMDYNEIRKPAVYIDKTLPDSIIPYFATVPVGYEFGTTPYEILQELFLTQPLEEDDEDDQEDSYFVRAKKSNKANKVVSDYLKSYGLTPSQLEMAAFPNSERLKAEIESNSGKILAKNIPTDNIIAWSIFPERWRPDGTLKFRDAVENKPIQPLVGVRVTAGYLLYWRSSNTDSNGYFRSPERWTFSVDYEANFDSHQFLLEDGHSSYGEDLEIEKNNTKKAWNEIFREDHARWCAVWTAAWNYWYGNIYGLQRPRQNEWWNQSLNILVYYKNNEDYEKEEIGSSSGVFNIGPFKEYIAIKAYNRSQMEIYGTTIHEISHSSHYWNVEAILGMNDLTYTNLPKKLKESYATGIQRYLSIKRYGNWSKVGYDDEYTGIFEDLEDTDSTYAIVGGRRNPCDKVSGITAPMAEKAVFSSLYWEHSFFDNFKDKLMEYYPSGTLNEDGKEVSYTKDAMNALFKYWNTWESIPCPEPSSSSVMLSSSSVITSDDTEPYFKDIRDEYVYKTIKIGEQYWLAENLNYNAPGSRCYDDDPDNCKIYGRLYDWATSMALPDSCNVHSCSSQISAKHQGICPSGWHIPTLTEWNEPLFLANGYDSYFYRLNYKLLSTSSLWSYESGTDNFGFSALPGGEFNGESYSEIRSSCWFWTATEGSVSSDDGSIYENDKPYNAVYETNFTSRGGKYGYRKTYAFSIRCVKD